MLGLGETWDEILEVMHDMREHDVDILTIGQYLRPSFQHLPIQRYIPLEEFATLKAEGKKMGFRHVRSRIRAQFLPRPRTSRWSSE